jgi:hypothetical protein
LASFFAGARNASGVTARHRGGSSSVLGSTTPFAWTFYGNFLQPGFPSAVLIELGSGRRDLAASSLPDGRRAGPFRLPIRRIPSPALVDPGGPLDRRPSRAGGLGAG